jgi:hypothetical protein
MNTLAIVNLSNRSRWSGSAPNPDPQGITTAKTVNIVDQNRLQKQEDLGMGTTFAGVV